MEDNKPINIRKIGGAEILETLNCAAIAERFFNKYFEIANGDFR